MSKPIYTVSVSKLDAFDKFVHRQTEDNEQYNNEQTFLATLMGKFVQIDHAKYGECFHAIVEGIAQRVLLTGEKPQQVYKYKEVMIPDAQAQHAIDYGARHAGGISELAVSKRYSTRWCDLIVTGRLDKLIGNWIRDCKTKYSSPDMQEDYIDSAQWKFYLDMMDLDVFWYDVFQVSGFNALSDMLTAKIKPLEPMYCVRYPELPEDIQSVMEEFVEYVQFKNLQQWIEVSPISTVSREYKLHEGYVWNDETILSFGKHRGKCLAHPEVQQYLQWLNSTQVLPADLKTYMKSKKLIV